VLPERDVRLQGPEIAAAVEHDRERIAQRQSSHPERHGRRRLGFHQCSPEQLVGLIVVHATSFPEMGRLGEHNVDPPGGDCQAHRHVPLADWVGSGP
jgi:hypothetical protein